MGSDLKRDLRMLIEQFSGGRDAYASKVHHKVFPRIVDVLYSNGCKLQRAANIKQRHVEVVFRALAEQGAPYGTWLLVWNQLNSWVCWVGKAGMLAPLESYMTKYQAGCPDR